MKHWEFGGTLNNTSVAGLSLKRSDDKVVATDTMIGEPDRIISICVDSDGMVAFIEQCDGVFGVKMSRDIAVEVLQEAIEWIKSQFGLEITDSDRT